MIKVRLLGHIKTAVGKEEIQLDDRELEARELVEKLAAMCREEEPGFNEYNTLVVVEDAEAFVPASTQRKIRSGQKVVLIPFSHGG